MSDDKAEARRPWHEGPDEDVPPESWLRLEDDELLHRIETAGTGEHLDELLLEVVTSDRHFFIRQEAAKRIHDRRRLFAFEDDRHVGQILVRHLRRREDVTYLERISLLSRHVEVRSAAQVQLARVWRRLEATPGGTRPPDTHRFKPLALEIADPPAVSSPSSPSGLAEPDPAAGLAASAASDAEEQTPAAEAEAPLSSAAVDGEAVDGSLLGWATHFIVEHAWNHLGTTATRELLRQTYRELLSRHACLARFSVGEDARVSANLEAGPRMPRAAVRDVATWMTAFRLAAQKVAPEVGRTTVRASTALMIDALRDAGFYAASDEAEGRLSG
jgi:hypothetical protein